MVDPTLPIHSRTALAQLQDDVTLGDLRKILAIYKRDVDAHMKAIAAAFTNGDKATIGTKCHAIRSASQSLGFTRLAAILMSVEMSAISHNDDAAEKPDATAITTLMAAYEEIKPVIEQLNTEFGVPTEG